ncbi:MAG: hypothetical protein ACI9ND_002811 [Yoonia sp.]|jgi:hypothetical protein
MAELECCRAQKSQGSKEVMHCVDLIVEDGELALSHFRATPSARLSHLPFKRDLTFSAPCCVTSIASKIPRGARIVEAIDVFHRPAVVCLQTMTGEDCHLSRTACLP